MRKAWGLIGALVLAGAVLCAAGWWLAEGPSSSPASGLGPSTAERGATRRTRSSPSTSERLEVERPNGDPDAPSGEPVATRAPTETGLPCELAGRVIDEEGRPVPGVEVQLAREEEGPVSAVRTDAQGSYQFPALVSGDATLIVNADEYLEQQLDVPLVPGPNLFDFTLRHAVSVTGVVVDEAGQPVADVDLSLMRMPTQGTIGIDATSGADGTFRLKAEEPGPYRVRMEHTDYLTTEQDVTAPVERLRLVLHSGMSIEVEVMDEAGHPVPQATVYTQGEQPEEEQAQADVTNEAGKAVLKGLKPARYQVLAALHAPGHLRLMSAPVEARAPGLVRVRLQFEPGLRLSGVVVDRAGKPVIGAEVRLVLLSLVEVKPPPLTLSLGRQSEEREPAVSRELLEDAWTSGAGTPLETGGDGRFSASGLKPGTYLVTAVKPGYAVQDLPDEFEGVMGVRASAGGSDVRLVLDFLGLVRGRLVNEDGTPITSFQLNDEPVSNTQGLFQKTVEEPGEQELTLVAEGVTGVRRKVRVREGEEVDLGNVVLRKGREVRVRAVDARTSQPVEGVEVDVLGHTPRSDGEPDSRLDLISTAPRLDDQGAPIEDSEHDFSTSEEGLLVLTHVEEQPLRLQLTHRDYETESVPLGSGQREVVVHLRPASQRAEPSP